MTTKGRPPKAQGETLARLSQHIKHVDNSYHRLGKILVGLENELVGNKHEERITDLVTQVIALKKENLTLKVAANQLINEMHELGAEMQKAYDAIKTDIKEHDSHPKRITALEEELVDLKEWNEELKCRSHSMEKFRIRCNTRITALEEHIKYIINDVVDMFDKLKSPRIMKIEEVEELTTLKRLTIWREEKQGRFPKHRQLTNKSIGWISSEIEDWIATHTSIIQNCNLHKEPKND